MPKLYEYFGLIVLFYSNDHDPIHVHGKYQGKESRAEIITNQGNIVEIRFSEVKGKDPLKDKEFTRFAELINAKKDNIITKWIDFFVYNKSIQMERITKRIKL